MTFINFSEYLPCVHELYIPLINVTFPSLQCNGTNKEKAAFLNILLFLQKKINDRALRILCKFCWYISKCYVNVKSLLQISHAYLPIDDICGFSTVLFFVICAMNFKTFYNLILKKLNRMKLKNDWVMFNHLKVKSDKKKNE